MSSTTSGSFTASTLDLNIGVSSWAVNMDNASNGGAGVLVSPLIGEGPWQGITVYNRSPTEFLRILLTFIGQIAGASDTEILVPPNATSSTSFDGDAIQQFSAQYVAVPPAAGVYTANTMTPAALAGIHQFSVVMVNG